MLAADLVTLPEPLGTRIVEGVLLKPAFPAEYHGESSVEAALVLHRRVADRLEEVRRVEVRACEAALRIIDKTGPLHGHADRDHCLQYMVAVALVHGELTERHYGDEVAADPRVDALRSVVDVVEDPSYTRAYHDPTQRAVPARVTVHLEGPRSDSGSHTEEVWFPVGHPRRRLEAEPYVRAKLCRGIETALPAMDAGSLAELLLDRDRLQQLPVSGLVDALVP